MSPRISTVPAIHPKVLPLGVPAGAGGTTCAIGFPRLVIVKGSPVFLTRSRSEAHVALNLEMAMVSMAPLNLSWDLPQSLRELPNLPLPPPIPGLLHDLPSHVQMLPRPLPIPYRVAMG